LKIDPIDISVKKGYIYANSQILAVYKGDWRNDADKYFYLHDRLGSVRQIINNRAEVKQFYTYNPFGETIDSDSGFDNPFMFTGQYLLFRFFQSLRSLRAC